MSFHLPRGSRRFLAKPLPGSNGFLSRVFSVTRPGDSRRYILKVGSDIPERREWAGELRVFERELAAYRLLAPLGGKLSPRLFAGASADHGSDGLLLLEELRKGRTRDQLQGLTWTELASAARAIARIHARFWNSSDLKKARSLPPHHYMRAHEARNELPAFFRWAKCPTPERSLFKELPRRVNTVLARLRKRPVTLVHGDFRADNIFFGKGCNKIIDWAFATRGVGAFDVARLAGGSPKTPLTFPQHADLFMIWHTELLRHGVRGYPKPEAWQDYRDATLLTLTIPVTNAPVLARFSPRGRRMAKLITKRFICSASLFHSS